MKVSGSLLEYDTLKPIIGANVNEVGFANSTTTNAQGKFTINVDSPESMIKFSHIQYDFDTVKASDFNSYYELYLASDPNGATVINNYKKPSSFWLIAIAGLVTVAALKLVKSGKATKVKV